MRQFWMGFFMVGLLMVGWSAHERRQSSGTPSPTGVAASMAEDGTGFPHPSATPTPRP